MSQLRSEVETEVCGNLVLLRLRFFLFCFLSVLVVSETLRCFSMSELADDESPDSGGIGVVEGVSPCATPYRLRVLSLSSHFDGSEVLE